jgi:hypothetical protein
MYYVETRREGVGWVLLERFATYHEARDYARQEARAQGVRVVTYNPLLTVVSDHPKRGH